MGIQYWKQDGIPVAELTGPEKRIVDAPSALELAMTARHEACLLYTSDAADE